MELYKNGHVVSQVKEKNYRFNIWPLEDMENDQKAVQLTEKAYDKWFYKYPMHQIVPDFDYAKRYLNYCREIGLDVNILLYETPDDDFTVNGEDKISQELSYDCMGNIYYSYLKEEYILFKDAMEKRGAVLNENNLCSCLDDVMFYIELRSKAKASGWDLEDYWKETPAKISVIDY